MDTEHVAPFSHSRRALLASAVGAAAAFGAHALGRPAPVRANDPNDVVLGSNFNDASTTTRIRNPSNTSTAFWGSNEMGGTGVFGSGSGTGNGVAGSTASRHGVDGFSTPRIGG